MHKRHNRIQILIRLHPNDPGHLLHRTSSPLIHHHGCDDVAEKMGCHGLDGVEVVGLECEVEEMVEAAWMLEVDEERPVEKPCTLLHSLHRCEGVRDGHRGRGRSSRGGGVHVGSSARGSRSCGGSCSGIGTRVNQITQTRQIVQSGFPVVAENLRGKLAPARGKRVGEGGGLYTSTG